MKYRIADDDLESLLTEAIHRWNPALPRRWLYRFDYLHGRGRRGPLYARYCLLRDQALAQIKPSQKYAQGWPAEGLRVSLTK